MLDSYKFSDEKLAQENELKKWGKTTFLVIQAKNTCMPPVAHPDLNAYYTQSVTLRYGIVNTDRGLADY